MKPQEAVELLVSNGWHKDAATELVAEIQRDAREGMIDRKLAQETLEKAMETMVPVEDLRPLLSLVSQTVWPLSDVLDAVVKLRAKHPNLFPK